MIKIQYLGGKANYLIRRIGGLADKKGIRAYLVGGVVRDILLRRKNLDLDIVIEGDAIAFSQFLQKSLKGDLVVHKSFKTATFSLKSGLRIDLATARKESYPTPGSLPIVKPGSIYDDLFRRDFSINAIAVRINRRHFGEEVDFFGGIEDLKKGCIRVLHSRSFIDDPTRIWRAIRFEQRLDFALEPLTEKYLKQAVRQKVYEVVKPPRYFAEFKKILEERPLAKYIKRAYDLKTLHFLHSGYTINPSFLKAISQAEGFLKEVHRFAIEREVQDWLVFWLLLADRLKWNRAQQWAQRFNFDRFARLATEQMGDFIVIEKKLKRKNIKPSTVYCLLRPYELETVIFFAVKTHSKIIFERIKRYLSKYWKVKPSLKGEDLLTLGFVPGKELGEVLNDILYHKLDGRFKSRRDEWQYAKRIIETMR